MTEEKFKVVFYAKGKKDRVAGEYADVRAAGVALRGRVLEGETYGAVLDCRGEVVLGRLTGKQYALTTSKDERLTLPSAKAAIKVAMVVSRARDRHAVVRDEDGRTVFACVPVEDGCLYLVNGRSVKANQLASVADRVLFAGGNRGRRRQSGPAGSSTKDGAA